MVANQKNYAQSPGTLLSTSPATFSQSAALNTNVSATFDDNMIAPSASNIAMRLFGNKRGAYSYTAGGTYSGVNTPTITYNPTRTFLPGELLSIINNASTDNGVLNSRPTNSYFWASSGAATAEFTASTNSGFIYLGQDRNFIDIKNADLDGDADLDIVFSFLNDAGRPSLGSMLNNGTGGFTSFTTLYIGSIDLDNGAQIVLDFDLGDLNHDGDVDVALSVSGSIYSIMYLFSNNGAATFSSASVIYSGIKYDVIKLVDIDADGDLDLLGLDRGNGLLVSRANSGVGNFGAPNTILTLSGIYNFIAADFNGDRRIDVLSTRSSSAFIRVSLQQATLGTYATTSYNTGTNVSLEKVKILDLENDGDLDVAALNLNDQLVVFMSNLAGVFSISSSISATGITNFDLADYDGDGDFDMGFSAGSNSLQVYKNSAGTFTPFSNISLGTGAINNIDQMCSGDFDGDGDIDVIGKPDVQIAGQGYPIQLLSNNNLTLTSGVVTGPFCTGSSFNVTYIANGGFNIGNIFSVQISDATGSFASPITIGSLSSTSLTGTIACSTPTYFNTGTGYKIRVVSSSVAFIGAESNSFTITALPVVALTSRACNSTTATAITVSGANTYSWSPATGLNNTNSASVIASPSTPTIYTVVGTTNGCTATGTISVSNTCYCVGNYDVACSSADFIESVDMNNIDNTGSGCDGNLGNYIAYPANGNLTTTLQAGNSYNLFLTSGTFAQGFGVWIDYNIDNDFDDAGEFVYSVAATNSGGATITLPVSVVEGQSVMRVRSIYNITPATADVCNNQTYGETEDYKVNLVNPLSVTSTLPIESSSNAALSSDLIVNFSTPVVANSNIFGTLLNPRPRIHGQFKGLYNNNNASFTFSGAGTASFTYNLNQDFNPGERIVASLPVANGVNGSTLVSPYQFEFTTAAGFGTARFQTLTSIASVNISDIVAGDFNNDGDVDYAVTRALSDEFATTMQVYSNNSAGTFSSSNAFSTFYDISIAAGDLDNDGDLDLVTAVPFGSNQMDFYTNDGAGAFSFINSTWTTEAATNVEVADMDGDGDLDIVCSNPTSGRLFYYVNTGIGTFATRFTQTPILIQALASINSFTIGDFNKDGLLDVASGRTTSGFIRINYNTLTSPGTFQAAVSVFSGSTIVECGGLKSFDYDSDGDLDIAATKGTDGTVIIVRNNYPSTGASSYALAQTLTVNASPQRIEAADFDGDSDIDLYVAHSAATAVYISNNAGTFAVTTNTTGGSPAIICSADFDEDGDIDVVGKAAAVTATPISFIQNQEYIVTAAANTNPACAGSFMSIGRTLSPITWPNTTFTAELSDASGNFASPVILGSVTTTTGFSSAFLIPANTPAGAGYRIRWINNLTGSTLVQSGTFTINTISVFNVTGGGAICSNTNATINLSGSTSGVKYRLIRNSVIYADSINGNGSPISFTTNVAGTYTIQAIHLTTACSAFMNGNVVVTVNPAPAVFNSFGGGSYCVGGAGVTINLNNSTSGVNYELLLAGVPTGISINSTSGGPLTFTNILAAGTYTIRATNNITGCTAIMNNSPVVTVIPAVVPSVTIGTVSNPTCAGAGVNFTANPINGGTPTYTWFVNAVNAGASSTSGTFSSSSLVNGDVVTVSMSSSFACASPNPATANVTMTVNPNVTPTITINTAQTTICAGALVSFTSGITNGGASPQYQWQINGINVGGATGSTFTTSALTNGQSVRCRLTSNANCATPTQVFSSDIVMTVNSLLAPTAVINTANTNICSGQSVAFTSNITNGGTLPQYQWQINGVNVGGATSSSFTTTALTGNDQVRVRLTSNATCASPTIFFSLPITMNVTSTVVPAVSISPANNPICSNDGAFTVFSATVTNGGTDPEISWFVNGVLQSTGANNFTFASYLYSNGDIVKAELTSNSNCASPNTVISNSVTIIVNTAAVPTIAEIFAGTLQSSSAVSYQWFLNGSPIAGATNQSYAYSSVGNYTVQITDANGCSELSIAYSIGVPTISVTPVSGPFCPGANFNITYTTSSNFITGNVFTAQLSNASGGFSSAVNIGTLTSISSGTISATIPGGTPFGTGYRIRVIASNPIASSSPTPNFTINAITAAGVSIVSNPTGAQCAGTNILFTATPVNGGSLPQYQWRVNGSPIGGATNSTFNTSTLNNNDIVTVTLTSNLACVTGSPVTFSGITQLINPVVVPTVSISGNVSGCAGDLASYTSIINNGGASPAYQWKINGTNVLLANNATFSTLSLNNNDVVSLQLTSNALCASPTTVQSNNINYTLNALPIAYNLSGGGVICPNASSVNIDLDGSQTGVNYQLLNGISPVGLPLAGTGNPISFSVSGAGNYTVVATSSASCTNNMNGSVIVTADPTPDQQTLTGTTPICVGDFSEILISNSQLGFTYQLFYSGNPVGSLQAGTGAAISFGFYQDAGLYTVQITNISSLCQTELLSSLGLDYSASPTVFNLSGASSICPGESATYTLSGSELGTDYSLLLNGVAVQNLAGTGTALVFNPVSAQGTYTIDAQLGSCAATMNDTINLIEFLPPVSYTLSGPAFLCQNGTSFLTLSGSELGLVYDLNNDFGYTGQSIVGTGASLNFSINAPSIYEVFATSSDGCSASVGFVNIPAANEISAYNLSGGGTICSGDLGVTIALNGSETGVNYFVYLNGAAYDGPFAGTNLPLTIGTYTDAGNYTVVAIDNIFSCEVDMLGAATINVLPGIPSANAGSDQSICNNNTSMSANNAGSGNTGTWSVLSGTGVFVNANNPITTVNNIGFGSNAYIWTITNGTCAPQRDTVKVFRNNLPTVFNTQGGGLFCAGAAGVNVSLSGSQIGVDYVLSANGLPIGNLYGTNASLNFGLQTISGNYTISATDTVTGCSANMNGVAVVNELPVPPAPIVTVVNNCGSSEITATGFSGILLWNDGLSFNPRIETSGTYTATQEVLGCESAASIAVTANPLIIPVTLPNPANTTPPCNAAGINYSVVLTTGSSYAWSVPVGSSIVSGAVGPNNNSISVNFGNISGDIAVTETNADGCLGDPIVYFINLQGCNLVADFVANNTTICEGDAVTYTNLSTGTSIGTTYNWNFGTGATPTSAIGEGPHTVTYNTVGQSSISLTITEGASVTETKSNYININAIPPAPTLTIANNCGSSTVTANGIIGALAWSDGGIGNPRIETSGTFTATQTVAGCLSLISNSVTANPLSFPTTSAINGNAAPNCFASAQVYSVTLTSGSSYAWTVPAGATIVSGSTGPNNNSISVNFGNTNGTISVTETAANGCLGSPQTLAISLSGCGVVIDFNSNKTTVCAGQTVTFTNAVTGTIGATDLNWDFGVGATPSTITGNGPHTVIYNTPGLIDVTLTLSGDVNGTLTKTDYIEVNPQITDLTITSVNETCGANNGVIQITGVIGGEATFNYEINGGGLTPSNLYSNLNSGTYLVAVSDVNGCTYSENVTINSIDGPTALSISINDATCGNSNGSIDVTSVTGGTAAYSYSLDGIAYVGTTLFSGLASGAYTIFVRDANNCVFSQGFNINNTAGVTAITTNINNATCGNSNGSVLISAVTGGTPGYLYNIDGGSFNTTNTFFGLAGGNYTIGIQDANGCVYTELVNVNSLAGPSGLGFNITDETCDQVNGSVDVNFTLGAGALFSVTFNGVSSLNTNYLGLSGGNYFVTVLDVNGCSISSNAIVNSTAAITNITTNIANATCGISNGSIDITSVTGGTAAYTYSLDGVTYVGTTLFSGLASGAYTIFVQDANSCIFSQGFNINNTSGVTSIATSINDATCGISNGSIDLNITGGTGPFTFLWDNGATTEDINTLSVGAYNVTVTDNNGCTASTSATINNIGGPSVSTTQVDATCGNNNGSIDLNITGGTGPFAYNWSNGATTEDINTLTVGAYNVTVTDNNGCSATTSANINNIGGPSLSTTQVDATCGINNGSIDLTVSGGTGPFTFLWDNGATIEDINTLTVGTYNVTVTDNNGCTASTSATINNIGGPSLSTTQVDATCGISNGSIDLTVSGGTGPFTFLWDNGATTEDINTLTVGTYNVTVTDNNGCTASTSATINNIGGPSSINSLIVGETCGSGNGSVEISAVIGGTSPYQYAINTQPFTVVPFFFGLSAGIDTVFIQDSFGCVFEQILVIGGTAAATANAGSDITVCENTPVVLSASGGISYSWNNGLGTAATANIIATITSDYIVDVTDVNGCNATDTVVVFVNTLPSQPVITASGPTTFCFGGSVDLTSSYVGGNSWSTSSTTDFININGVGTYNVDVTYTDVNGCSSTSAPINVTVNALPAQPVITAFGSLVICNGSTVTLASNEPSGNIWSNSENTQSIDVSASGIYTVTYTDGNACSKTSDAVEVIVNTPFLASLNLPNTLSCEGGAAVVLSGGTPIGGNYIGAGIINNVLYPTLLPAGIYNVEYMVNDINGCIATTTQNYTINAAPFVTAFATQTVLCLNDVPTLLTGSPLGGVFTGNGVVGTTFDPTTAGAGIHTITYQYTDVNTCSSITSFDVIVNPLPQLTLLPVASLCLNSGTFVLNNGFPVGGTYLIDGILATEINTNTLSAGVHTLTYNYSPANGCGNSISTQFTINPLPVVSLPVFANICETAAPLILTGGLPAGGSYTGSGVLGGVFYPNLANPINNITYAFTDPNGCSVSTTQNITVLTPQAINFAPISPVCLNTTAITLNSASPAGGIYSGVGVVSNTFDPVIAGVGVHLIQYETVDGNGCISTSNQTINVNALPVLSSISLPAICGNDNVFALTFAQPIGGVYSGTGVSNNMFDPSIAGNGNFNLLYVFTDNNSCADTISENIIVNAAPTVTHTNYTATCGNAGLITLNNGLPLGGVYTGNFVSNGLFNSNLSGGGTFAIDYTFTDVNGCSGAAYANIVVNSLPSASLSSLGNICSGAGNIVLNNGLPLGGTYYGTGIINGVLDPTALPNGTQTLGYTYTDGNGCVDSVTINYNTYTLQANAGIDQSITCTTSALLQAQSNYSGNGLLNYSWSPSLGLSSTTTQNTVATPSSSTNYVLTVSDGVCSSNDTVLVLVSQPNFNLAVTPSAQILNTAPFIVLFTNNTPNPSNYSFVWHFGDGTTYSGFQPVYHNYTSNGSFTVKLIATALGSGCVDTLVMSNLITCNNGVFCNDSANVFIDGVLIPNNSSYSTTICANQNFLLGCNTGADYSYQWYYNGIPLQAGFGSTYAPSVTGYYTVGVEDSSCINLSSPVYITVLPLPSTPFITSTGSNNFCGGGSLTLNANAGYSSYLWSTGSTQSSIVINTSGSYWVQGFDANGCYAQSLDFEVNGSNMLPQYICVSTVDTLLNKNRIIWEKPLTTSIDSFVVYKESNLAGVYNEIGRVDYNNNSEFLDTASLPDINNNRYRLAVKDSCGNMTTLGDIHGTIKTTITPLGNGDSLEVFFTKYIGIDSLSYTLYRGPSANAMSPASSAFTFNSNANIYSIKDLSPPAYPSGYVYYQVRANLDNLCNSDSNVYHQSISNTIGYGNALGLEQSAQLFEVNAFPNPNNGVFNINIETTIAEDLKLVIYNKIGAVVWIKQLEKLNGKTNIFVPLEQVAQGVYQLQVTGSKRVVNKRLIINK